MKYASKVLQSFLTSKPVHYKIGNYTVINSGSDICPFWVIKHVGTNIYIEAKFKDCIYAAGFADKRYNDETQWQ